MTTKAIRHSVINMRTTEDEKSLLQKAADFAGFSNLTNFIMTVARREAHRLLSDYHTTYLSAQDWEQVNQLMANPPKANAKLKKLLKEENKQIKINR